MNRDDNIHKMIGAKKIIIYFMFGISLCCCYSCCCTSYYNSNSSSSFVISITLNWHKIKRGKRKLRCEYCIIIIIMFVIKTQLNIVFYTPYVCMAYMKRPAFPYKFSNIFFTFIPSFPYFALK